MRKTRKLAISIMSFVFAVATGLLATTASRASKVLYTDALSTVEYKQTYTVGESVEIQPAEFEYKGKTYKANVLIRFPSGSSYKYDEAVLSEAGNYYVDYSAVADDNTLLKETKAFTVLADVYSFNGDGSYTYGTNDYLDESVKGLNVTLGRNSTFTINTPIDISNLTKEDSIVKLYATPAITGVAEAGVVYIRLTDAHDKSKYVEVQYHPVSTFHYAYASANDQLLTGLRQTSEPTKDSVEYDGFYYNLSHNNVKKAGHVSRASLTGTLDATNRTNTINKYFSAKDAVYSEQDLFYYNALEIRMDYTQKRVYSQPDSVYTSSRSILADFDDERTLGGRSPWEGFTTGEVFVSIYAKDYTTTDFNFFITDIHGQEVKKTTMRNELAPRISVDTQGYEASNLPNAIVGKKYDLFNAVAMDDMDGEVDVTVKVYNSIGASLSIKDNAFIPTQAGTYTIEYGAIDAFENKTVKTFTLKAMQRNELAYTLGAGETQFKAGQTVALKEIAISNPSNLYDLKIIAKNEAENATYEIGEDLSFVPLYAGTYKVSYLYTDYCTEQEISYEIVVESSDLAVFEDGIVLPRYIIKGLDYPVLEAYGYTFANGTQREQAKLYIKAENQSERLIEGDSYRVDGEATYVDLIYKIGEHKNSRRLPVIDAVRLSDEEGYLADLSKYFYPTAGTFVSAKDKKKVKMKVLTDKNDSASFEVINPARLINDFNIGFHFETGEANFQGVKVIFESAYNADKTVEFAFERNIGDIAKVWVSGSNGFRAEDGVSAKFKTPVVGSDNFNITYDSATKTFDVSGFIVDATKLLQDFDDLFYISFEMYGIDGNSAINITRVVNQKITNDEYDGVKPVVIYDSFKGYYVIGDEIQLNKIRLYDFVDPNPTCTLSLQDETAYLTATNGVKIDGKENHFDEAYTVAVTKIGRINVRMKSEDFSGNNISIAFAVMVRDVVAPTVELVIKSNLYKVGATVTIADCIAEDESTEKSALEITYYVINPDASVKYLSQKSFKAEKAGTYTVCYIVRDEAGNNAYANYLIYVE